MEPVNIGLLGMGTVGGGTVTVLTDNAGRSLAVPGGKSASPMPRHTSTTPRSAVWSGSGVSRKTPPP